MVSKYTEICGIDVFIENNTDLAYKELQSLRLKVARNLRICLGAKYLMTPQFKLKLVVQEARRTYESGSIEQLTQYRFTYRIAVVSNLVTACEIRGEDITQIFKQSLMNKFAPLEKMTIREDLCSVNVGFHGGMGRSFNNVFKMKRLRGCQSLSHG